MAHATASLPPSLRGNPTAVRQANELDRTRKALSVRNKALKKAPAAAAQRMAIVGSGGAVLAGFVDAKSPSAAGKAATSTMAGGAALVAGLLLGMPDAIALGAGMLSPLLYGVGGRMGGMGTTPAVARPSNPAANR